MTDNLIFPDKDCAECFVHPNMASNDQDLYQRINKCRSEKPEEVSNSQETCDTGTMLSQAHSRDMTCDSSPSSKSYTRERTESGNNSIIIIPDTPSPVFMNKKSTSKPSVRNYDKKSYEAVTESSTGGSKWKKQILFSGSKPGKQIHPLTAKPSPKKVRINPYISPYAGSPVFHSALQEMKERMSQMVKESKSDDSCDGRESNGCHRSVHKPFQEQVRTSYNSPSFHRLHGSSGVSEGRKAADLDCGERRQTPKNRLLHHQRKRRSVDDISPGSEAHAIIHQQNSAFRKHQLNDTKSEDNIQVGDRNGIQVCDHDQSLRKRLKISIEEENSLLKKRFNHMSHRSAGDICDPRKHSGASLGLSPLEKLSSPCTPPKQKKEKHADPVVSYNKSAGSQSHVSNTNNRLSPLFKNSNLQKWKYRHKARTSKEIPATIHLKANTNRHSNDMSSAASLQKHDKVEDRTPDNTIHWQTNMEKHQEPVSGMSSASGLWRTTDKTENSIHNSTIPLQAERHPESVSGISPASSSLVITPDKGEISTSTPDNATHRQRNTERLLDSVCEISSAIISWGTPNSVEILNCTSDGATPGRDNTERPSDPVGGMSSASSSWEAQGREGDSDAGNLIKQVEGDEEIARKLQEEMDLEFALSIQNLENQPPPVPEFISPAHQYIQHHNTQVPISGGSPTAPRRRWTAGQRGRFSTRQPDLEELEAMLHAYETNDISPVQVILPSGNRRRGRDITGRRRGYRRTAAQHLYINSPSSPGNDYEDLLNLAEMLGDVKHKGLNDAQMSRLPERKYQSTNNSNSENEECMICMCDYEQSDNLKILPCFHEFHSTCINKWIQGNASCPICRVEVKL